MRTILLALLISASIQAASASSIQDYLIDIQIENKAYDLELKKWLFVKPKLKLRRDNFHSGTPISHPVAETLTTYQLVEFLKTNDSVISINVLSGESQKVIPGGYWVKGVAGHQERYKNKLKSVLANLADGKDSPIVIYCLSAQCWNSYNSVIHAHELGYTNLIWYRGGINAWNEAGLLLEPADEYILPQ